MLALRQPESSQRGREEGSRNKIYFFQLDPTFE
jgi:hypothetical protein